MEGKFGDGPFFKYFLVFPDEMVVPADDPILQALKGIGNLGTNLYTVNKFQEFQISDTYKSLKRTKNKTNIRKM